MPLVISFHSKDTMVRIRLMGLNRNFKEENLDLDQTKN